jgi:CheY-like chemotaxis protein
VKDILSHFRLRWPDAIIVSVARGFDAVELVEAEAPDLILAGSSLQDMSLLDLVNRIRQFSDVPLIVLAAGREIQET